MIALKDVSLVLSLSVLITASPMGPHVQAQGLALPLPPQRPGKSEAAPRQEAAPKPETGQKTDAPPTIERVNAYFNAIKGLQADFVQLSPDGRQFSGILYLLRPGMMRFAYDPPAALEVISDGRSVAVRDKKLNTQDVYFVGQTPLKFLLQPRIDIAKDSKVVDLRRVGPDVVLLLEDKSTIGGTSRIRVVFDGQNYALKEWTVTDPQGYDTRVQLSNLNPDVVPNKSLFVIEEQKIFNPN